MYDERKTGCKEVPNILLKCGYGISNAETRLLNCSANKVLITTNRILQSTLSTNKLYMSLSIIPMESNNRSPEAKLHATQMVLHYIYKQSVLQKLCHHKIMNKLKANLFKRIYRGIAVTLK